ncbi:hypothetical protein BH10PSE18_BH10PSE18_14600 [soil metagenome]
MAGSISFSLFFVFANCALTIYLLKKIVLDRFAGFATGLLFWTGCLLYAWSVFSHPYFYIFGAWDAYAQFSYFFLACSIAWYLGLGRENPWAVGGLFILSALGFLAKETYFLTLLLLLPFIVFASSKQVFAPEQRALKFRALISWSVFIPLLAIFCSFALALGINAALKSPFTTSADIANQAYKISIAPSSVLKEWFRYARDGASVWTALTLAIFIGGIVLHRLKGLSSLSWLFIGAGVLAWLPNSVLPNHHFAFYSFTGSYLYFLPVVLLFGFVGSLTAKPRGLMIFVALIAAMILLLPFANRKIYKRDEIGFYLYHIAMQEKIGRAVSAIAEATPPNGADRRELLIGIMPPFNPFDYPSAFQGVFADRSISLDVAAYGFVEPSVIESIKDKTRIRRLGISAIKLAEYDRVWSVAQDGSMIDLPAALQAVGDKLPDGLKKDDLYLYPELARIFGAAKQVDGQVYLACARALQAYEAFDKALVCLKKGIEIEPENPYPYFYHALASERLGKLDESIDLMKKAAAIKTPGSANPAFENELSRLQKKKNAS